MKHIGRTKHNKIGKKEFDSVYGGGTTLAGIPLSPGASKPFGRGSFGGALSNRAVNAIPPSKPRLNRPHM